MPGFIMGLLLVGAPALFHAQAPNPTSATNPFYGSVTAHPPPTIVLKLSLDEAIALGTQKQPRPAKKPKTAKRRFRAKRM
jgi:hypothetical protein